MLGPTALTPAGDLATSAHKYTIAAHTTLEVARESKMPSGLEAAPEVEVETGFASRSAGMGVAELVVGGHATIRLVCHLKQAASSG